MFSNNFLFKPISYELFKSYFDESILPYIDFRTSILMLNKMNKLIGYSLFYKDQMDVQRVLFKTIGILKEERKGGLAAMQLIRVVYLQARKNFKSCLACLMIEGNKIDTSFKKMSRKTIKYGLFQKEI